MIGQPLSPVVKNLLIINILMWLITYFLPQVVTLPGPDLYQVLSLHYYQSEYFRPHQFVTHMFMHGDFFHVAANMIGLIVFGTLLESVWGSKRFLTFYMITGLGAALLHFGFFHWEMMRIEESLNAFAASPDPDTYLLTLKEYFGGLMSLEYADGTTMFEIQEQFAAEWINNPDNHLYPAQAMNNLSTLYQGKIDSTMVGASGAVFGLLAAFGLLFPEVELRMFFFPIPIKAKIFVFLYAALEMYAVIKNSPNDNIAHFAHLGGALFGFILVKLWSREGKSF